MQSVGDSDLDAACHVSEGEATHAACTTSTLKCVNNYTALFKTFKSMSSLMLVANVHMAMNGPFFTDKPWSNHIALSA